MAALRTMAAAMAAVALVGRVRATERPLPPCLDPFQPFVYSGCFQDTGNPHIFPYRSSAPSDGMTIDKCVAECKGNGYRYAGLVYYGVCYCGQTVNGPQVDESQCNLPCNGNSTQTCGGNDIFSVYQDPTFQPVDDVTIADYHALGCYTDDSSLGKALVYRQDQLDAATLTTEKCLQACRDGGFPFAGTEYGGECYCGVVLGNDSSVVSAEECNMPCNGNPGQTCGGPARLNLFVAHELQSLEPCGYEPPSSSSSTLPPASTTSSSSSTLSPPTSTTSSTSSTSSSCVESTSTPTITATTSSTSSTSSSCAESSSNPTITATPSTSKISSTTTTSSSVCVSTTVVPPSCEWKCGKWCSSPLPDWDDVKGCKSAWSSCTLQVASCFKHAGWPDVLDCFDFGEWCADVAKYCDSKPRGGCNKSDFWGKKPPKGPSPPKTTTVVITTTCAPTSKPATATTTTKTRTTSTSTKTKPTSTSTSTKCPIPTPTNICIQPSNPHYGYGPGEPAGGIAMPVVTCNDLAADWPQWPFKRYSETDSRDCARYPRGGCAGGCADACREQYDACVAVYAEGCKGGRGRKPRGGDDDEDSSSSGSYFAFAARRSAVEKRTDYQNRWHDSYDGALGKCKAQYADCLRVNAGNNGAGKCPRYGDW
ncbi:hypothetical protein VTK56DRAFT_9296 [Thermocarpiscus australiensis]